MTDDVRPSTPPMSAQDEILECCSRQVAAKIVAMLPPDERRAAHILDLAVGLVFGIMSREAIEVGELLPHKFTAVADLP